ncbi:venom allergen 3-like [Anoplophora glabripennis]|uniref:venom allergen 3-like n=1 Tax=Anoplophora glabripennis TaxID=217634 RepID=UPI0008757FF5|nr:venom allergen 3-like [Anoplophora glabripennis]
MNAASMLCVYVIAIIASSLNVAHCAAVYERGVNDNEKQIIVNKHNELRRMISEGRVPGQPRGTNLKQLRYDENLAREAQKISDTCRFEHVKVSDGRWHAVGQNLYASYSTAHQPGANWAKAIQDWFNEYPYYKYGDRSTNHQNGHYTQVVWADTEYVGCGYTLCKGTSWPYEKIYTCNYGPAGNYVGQLPYRT